MKLLLVTCKNSKNTQCVTTLINSEECQYSSSQQQHNIPTTPVPQMKHKCNQTGTIIKLQGIIILLRMNNGHYDHMFVQGSSDNQPSSLRLKEITH